MIIIIVIVIIVIYIYIVIIVIVIIIIIITVKHEHALSTSIHMLSAWEQHRRATMSWMRKRADHIFSMKSPGAKLGRNEPGLGIMIQWYRVSVRCAYVVHMQRAGIHGMVMVSDARSEQRLKLRSVVGWSLLRYTTESSTWGFLLCSCNERI